MIDLPVSFGRPVPPVPPPPPEQPKRRLRKIRERPSFSDHATRMGREITRVGRGFKSAGVLIMIGALLLAAQSTLVLGSALLQAQSTAVPLGEAGAGDNSSANATFSGLAGSGRLFGRLAIATQFDLVGFCLLGAGLILLGRGARNIEVRLRATGDKRKVPRRAASAGVVSGALCFLWVALTVYWRSALTGTATGDWSSLASSLSTSGISSATGIPEGARAFLGTFPGVGALWVAASALLLLASLSLYSAARAVHKATGIKLGGALWVWAAGASTVATLVFVGALITIIGDANAASAQGGEPNYGSAFTVLFLGAGAKLVVAPLVSAFGFLALVRVGARIARFKEGKVLLSESDVRAILATPSAPPEVRVTRGSVLLGKSPPATMVSLGKKPR